MEAGVLPTRNGWQKGLCAWEPPWAPLSFNSRGWLWPAALAGGSGGYCEIGIHWDPRRRQDILGVGQWAPDVAYCYRKWHMAGSGHQYWPACTDELTQVEDIILKGKCKMGWWYYLWGHSFIPLNNPYEVGALIPLCRWRNWGTVSSNNMLMVANLVRVWERAGSQVIWLRNHALNHFTVIPQKSLSTVNLSMNIWALCLNTRLS